MARICPVLVQKKKKKELCNYRPTSVIPHVAKIAEKCVEYQLKEHLSNQIKEKKERNRTGTAYD